MATERQPPDGSPYIEALSGTDAVVLDSTIIDAVANVADGVDQYSIITCVAFSAIKISTSVLKDFDS